MGAVAREKVYCLATGFMGRIFISFKKHLNRNKMFIDTMDMHWLEKGKRTGIKIIRERVERKRIVIRMQRSDDKGRKRKASECK